MKSLRQTSRRRAFTLLEVLIGLSILTVGILAIIALFPTTMRGNEQAELRTIAASLMALKAEEIRRDNDVSDKLINAIKNLGGPTAPITFPYEPRLAYRFSSTTMLYEKRDAAGGITDDPTDPRDDPGVARIIVQISPTFRPGKAFVLDELRFDK